MAFLDFGRFGISEDDIRNGMYKYVIGFDLGDGEISAAAAPLSGVVDSSRNLDLNFNTNDERKIVSGIFVEQTSNIVCGIMTKLQSMRNSQGELLLNFKATPSRLDSGELLEGTNYTKRELMQTILAQALADIYRSKGDKSFFAGRGILAVGCPSNRDWTTAEMQETYRRILAGALKRPELEGIDLKLDVMIIPESRASIIKVYKESSDIADRISRGAIVVDHGSSTLDVSMIDFGSNTMLEESIPLGAAKIEREILREFLRRKERRQSELQAADFDLLDTRMAKEAYFTNPNGSPRLYYDFADGSCERLTVTGDFMHSVTHEALIKYATSTNPGVEGSWATLHLNFLRRMGEWMKGVCGGKFDGVVMLTGGASRMDFVVENAHSVFPDALVVVDPEPSYCVSRGLVYAVIADVEAIRLASDVRSQIKRLVTTMFPEFNKVYSRAAANVIYSYMLECLREWRDKGANVTVNAFKESVGKRIAADSDLKTRLNRAGIAAVVSKLNDSSSSGMRARIVDLVNSTFNRVFPGKLSANAVANFKLDPSAWSEIADRFSADINLGSSVGIMSFNGFVGELLSMPLRVLLGLAGLFSKKARDAYDYVDGTGRTLSDKKRAEVVSDYVSHDEFYRQKIAEAIEEQGGVSADFIDRLTDAIMPAVSKAVDNVSLYF